MLQIAIRLLRSALLSRSWRGPSFRPPNAFFLLSIVSVLFSRNRGRGLWPRRPLRPCLAKQVVSSSLELCELDRYPIQSSGRGKTGHSLFVHYVDYLVILQTLLQIVVTMLHKKTKDCPNFRIPVL